MKNVIKLQAIFRIAAILRIVTAFAALSAFTLACGREVTGTIVVVNNREYTIDVTIIAGRKDAAKRTASIAAGESKAIAVTVYNDEEGTPWHYIYLGTEFARTVFVRNGETVTVKIE